MALLLIDGRRPLLGEGVPRGEVGEVLARTPPATWACWWPRRTRTWSRARTRPWWCRSAGPSTTGRRSSWEPGSPPPTARRSSCSAQPGETEERTKVTRLLGDAGLLVQQYAGIDAMPMVAEPGPRGDRRGGARGRVARGRPLRALARRGPRTDALGDREGGPGARAVRAPRRAARRARAEARTSPASAGRWRERGRRAGGISPRPGGSSKGRPAASDNRRASAALTP